MNNKGRPSIQEIVLKNLSTIGKMRRRGAQVKEIAERLGISKSSLEKATREIPEVKEEWEKSREALIEDLETSLYNRALGLCKQKTVKKFIEEVNGKQKQKIEETEVNLPPDVGALCFALKNLDKKRWSDNPQFDFAAMEDKLKEMKSFSERAKKVKGEVKEESPL